MSLLTLNEIYIECDNNEIEVYPFKLHSSAKGLALPDGYIAIDVDKINTTVEELEIVAHEFSHIQTGSFYNFYSPIDVKGKHERRAERATIKKLVPFDKFIEAINCGIKEHWELAEYFGVSCKFMLKCMELYKLN